MLNEKKRVQQRIQQGESVGTAYGTEHYATQGSSPSRSQSEVLA